jgi:hypothetical protein
MACMAKRGLLTLRDCENTEERNCANCGRPMCHEHLSARSGYAKCLECAAADPDKDQQYDAEWASGYRREYYRRSGYAPILFGAAAALGVAGLASAYWDHVDQRSFRSRTAGTFDDEDHAAGFGDS